MMQKNILLTLAYDGTRYSGWQKQGNTENTIQNKLETLLGRMFGQPIEIHGAGRTDAGVHACGQRANFKVDTALAPHEIMTQMNAFLPQDIAVVDACEVPARFHSRLSAMKKTYRYRYLPGDIPDVFNGRYVWQTGAALDAEAMARACTVLYGAHDFLGFCDLKRMKKSSVRTVYDAKVSQRGREVVLEVTATGFLYHMMRIIAGTLYQVGTGSRAETEFALALQTGQRADAGPLAPAKGLTLVCVQYPAQPSDRLSHS